MKRIAICSEGSESSCLIDARFGRCICFMIFDPETKEFNAISNGGRDAAHGAGTGSVQELLKNEVGTVITSRVGPKAFAALNQAGIKMFSCPEGETVDSALEKYLQNELAEILAANH